MRSHESIGKTVEEAISAGLEHLGLSIGDVTVDILEEGSKGLFGLFGSRPARVRMTVRDEEPQKDARSYFAGALSDRRPDPSPGKQEKADRQKPERSDRQKTGKPAQEPRAVATGPKAPAPAGEKQAGSRAAGARPAKKAASKPLEKPAEKAKEAVADRNSEPRPRRPRPKQLQKTDEPLRPAPQVDPAIPAGSAQRFLQELTALMGVEVSVSVSTDDEGHVRVNMEGDERGILIGRRGETLDALQYLTGLYVNRGLENYVRVTLDSEGYRAKREDALVRLATRMANRAQKTGRKVTMEPMNPYERRILHSALQNHPEVKTHSEGEEPNRHVVITLNRSTPADDRRSSEGNLRGVPAEGNGRVDRG